ITVMPLSLCQLLRRFPFLYSFPTRRSSDLRIVIGVAAVVRLAIRQEVDEPRMGGRIAAAVGVLEALDGSLDRSLIVGGCAVAARSEEHTSELQSRENLVCRLLLEKQNSCTK